MEVCGGYIYDVGAGKIVYKSFFFGGRQMLLSKLLKGPSCTQNQTRQKHTAF